MLRSTIGVEANAADLATDHIHYSMAILSEMLIREVFRKKMPSVFYVVATDSKNLWDATQKENPTVTEKRVLLDILAIKEQLSGGVIGNILRFKWVPTHEQMADGLTKMDIALRQRFLEWIRNPQVRLKDG